MDFGFGETLTTIGLLLIGAAVSSGLVKRTVLSIAVLSLGAGIVLGAVGAIEIDAESKFVFYVVELVLLVTLFADGLLVEQSFLRHHWRAPARALAVAMPLNAALLAGLTVVMFDASWAEGLLLGFILSPTDPVITSSVVASPRVPERVRNLLNLESGLNDGLALPFVLLFLAIAGTGGAISAGADSAAGLGLETVVGVAVGAGLGFSAGLLLDRLPEWAITQRYSGLYALGVGLTAFGAADLLDGNGLIAAFCGGVALAVPRAELPEAFEHFNEGIAAVLQVVAFALFGVLVAVNGLQVGLLEAAAFAVVAICVMRPLSILVAFLGVDLDRPEKLFVAWFGPKGIASILFALFLLDSGVPGADVLFDVAAVTILASILAHGLTDTVGAGWIERHMQGGDSETNLETPRSAATGRE